MFAINYGLVNVGVCRTPHKASIVVFVAPSWRLDVRVPANKIVVLNGGDGGPYRACPENSYNEYCAEDLHAPRHS